jgi:hypothetical protein
MEAVCRFLGLELDPGMLQPYQEKRKRMTDGIHALSRGLMDIKFHQYKDIDPRVADRWRDRADEDVLGDLTWQLAERLGYERRQSPRSLRRSETSQQLLDRLDHLSEAEIDSQLGSRNRGGNA